MSGFGYTLSSGLTGTLSVKQPKQPTPILSVQQDRQGWSTVWIMGIAFAGFIKVSGGRGYTYDIQHPIGKKGSRSVPLQKKEHQVVLTFRLVDDPSQGPLSDGVHSYANEQFQSYQQILSAVQTQADAGKAFDIQYPSLAVNGVQSLYLIKLGVLEPEGEMSDVLVATWQCAEFTPPPKNWQNAVAGKTSVPSTSQFMSQNASDAVPPLNQAPVPIWQPGAQIQADSQGGVYGLNPPSTTDVGPLGGGFSGGSIVETGGNTP
jgi:hypothetical protein